MIALEEEINSVKNDTTKIGDTAPKLRTLSDVVKQGNYTFDDVPEFQSRKWVKFKTGFENGVHEMSKTGQGLEIWAGQAALSIGGIAGSSNIENYGRSLIKSAYNEAEAKDKEYMQKAVPLSPSEYDDFSTSLGMGVANYGGMLALGYLTGGLGTTAKAANIAAEAGGIGSMFALELSGKAQDKINTYIEKGGNVDFKEYTADVASKDFMFSAMYAAGSAILEKKFGYGEQRKLFKMPYGERLKNIAKTAASEGGTELTQSLYETGIDLIGGYIDTSKLPERFMQAVQEGAVGAVLGGTAGIAAAINHRSQAKAILREELQNTVPAKDLDNVVDAVYESTSDSMQNIVAQELIQSEELRNKHGAVYDSIKGEIYKQINDIGAFSDVDEMKLSQYVEGTAKQFADQVLGEANKRGVVIDDVLKASEIVYNDGRLHLQEMTEEKQKVVKLKRLRDKRAKAEKYPSMLQFIRLRGGIIDEYGDLKAMDAQKQFIGLVNKNGVRLDDMGGILYESGYFQERPTEREVLEYIEEELKGVKHYPLGYAKQKEFTQAENEMLLNSEISEYADIMGYDLSNMSYEEKEQIYEQMQRNLNSMPDDDVQEVRPTAQMTAPEDIDALFDLSEPFFQIADENARLDEQYPAYEGETITINGQEKTVYNSNGDRIAKSKEALENFYKWFGDSKVVDEQGRPLVVYHGTRTRFSNFDKTKKGQASSVAKVGFWFSPSEQFGYNFAKDLWYGEEDALVMPVYLNLQNPKIYKSGEATEAEIKAKKEIYDEAKKKLSDFNKEYDRIAEEKGYYEAYTFRYSVDVDKLEKDFRYAKDELHAIQKTDAYEKFKQDVYRIDGQPVGNATVGGLGMALNDYSSPQKLAEKLKDEGYDGIIIENTEYDASNITNAKVNTQYVAFEPNQIKSTSNRGTYSESENIYLQSAFHGTPHPELEGGHFSLEKVGSGEGGAAHGYGAVYAALKYDVAEGYRKRLVRRERESVFPDSPEELAITTYLKNNQNKDAAIKELQQIEKAEYKKFGTKDENVLAYTNASQAQDYLRYVEESNLEKQIAEVENSKGQTYEVDIPENPYLMDEDEEFVRQPEIVRNALREIVNELTDEQISKEFAGTTYPENRDALRRMWEDGDYDFNNDGRGIYRSLTTMLGSKKAASQMLEKHGVKGITYEGAQDGRCFVIFNPEDVKVIQKFYQVKNLPKEKGKVKGAFDALTKSIEITSDADFSTYQHEFAHFWLDNIWNYAQSGKASERYMRQFNEIKKWLGVVGKYPNRQQHEKFARAYEKYLYNGSYANPIIGDVFREYEDFIREVYSSIAEIDTRAGLKKYQPVPRKVYDFFNSMVSGELPYYGDIENPKEEVQKQEKEVKSFVKEEQKQLAENTQNYKLTPVQTDTKTGYLTAYKKMTGQEVEAGGVKLEEEQAKAEKFVNENPELAKQIVNGVVPVPEGMLKNTIYLAYDKLQKRLGNTENRVNSLLNQAMELRRYGQEISSQRLAYADETSPLYWIRTVEENRTSTLADSNKMKIEELNNLVNKSIKDGMEQGKTAKEIAKELREQLGVTEFYQEEVYPSEESEQGSYNYIYKYVNQQLGLGMTIEEAETITRKADDMLASLNNSRAINGNPSVDYFVKQKELENYANSIAPSSQARILVSVIGRGNLLFSIKSPMTNVISNAFVGAYRAAIRRAMLGVSNSVVSPELIKQQKQYSWEVFRKTGYNVNNITPEMPRNTILGERLTHSEGAGKIRALGRFYENLIYKWSLGAGDVVFKDYAFTDYVALRATKEANGNVKKANEIFKDACLIEPFTELGKQIRDDAIQESLIATYQNRGLISEKALKARQAIDFGVGFGEFIAPFVKTPANVVSMGLKASFGAVKGVASEVIRDVKAGKIQKPTRENIDLCIQNGLGVLLAILVSSGIDDDDYMPPYALATNKDKQLAKELNISYNSIRIGDTWFSLDYLGPFAAPLVGVLQFRREKGAWNKIFGYIKSGAIQSLSIPAFGNIAEIFTDIENMVRKDGVDVAADTLNNTIQAVYSRAIPSIVSDVAKMIDPYDREATGLSKIQAKVPLARQMLPEKVNITSGIAESTDNPIQELLFGARVKTQVVNSVANELQRLNNKGYGVSLTSITQRGLLSDLDDSTKDNVRRDFAKEYSKEVSKLISTPKYQRMDDEDKQKAIDKIRDKIRNDLKRRYLHKR